MTSKEHLDKALVELNANSKGTYRLDFASYGGGHWHLVKVLKVGGLMSVAPFEPPGKMYGIIRAIITYSDLEAVEKAKEE